MTGLLGAFWRAASEEHLPATPWLRRGLAVFAAVLLVRVVLCFLVLPRSLPEKGRDGYAKLATTLASDGQLSFSPDAPPTLFRPPVFPAVLSLAYRLAGNMAVAVLLVNCLAVALAYALADRAAGLVLGRTVPFPWIVVLALLPSSVYYTSNGFSDTLFTFTVALHLLSVFAVFERGDVRSGVRSGVALALSALTRPILLPLPAVLLAYAWFRNRASIKAVLVSALAALALISPWTLRNYRLSGHVIPITTGAGFTSLTSFFMRWESHGRWGTDGSKMIKKAQREAIREALGLTGEAAEREWQAMHTNVAWDIRPEQDGPYARAAWDLIGRKPWMLVTKVASNAVWFWYLSSSSQLSAINGLLNLALLALALRSLRRATPANPMYLEAFVLFVGAFVAAYSMVLVATTRYSLPVQTLLAPFAAATLADAWTALRRRRQAVAAAATPA